MGMPDAGQRSDESRRANARRRSATVGDEGATPEPGQFPDRANESEVAPHGGSITTDVPIVGE